MLQLGHMTGKLSEKVELVTNKKVSEQNVTPKKASENKMKEKEKDISQSSAILKYKCDQCSCTFKKNITLKKHKNTRHGKSLNELGEGHFGFVFDVIPGQEEDAEKEWNKEQQHEPCSSIEED